MTLRMLRILHVLAAVQFTVIVDFMIIMPLGPQLIRSFHVSASEFSWIVSAYSLAGGFSAIIASVLLDRFDRKKSFILIYIGFLIGTYLCAKSSGAHQLVLARAFTGFFGGLLGAQVYAIAGDVIPSDYRGRSTAIIMGAFSAASVVGVPFGLQLAQIGDWHFPFQIIVFLGIILLVALYVVLPNMEGHIQKERGRDFFEIYRYVLSSKRLIYGLLLYPSLMFAHFSVIPFISTYAVFNVGFPEGKLFLVYMIGGGATIFSSYFIGKWVDKTSPFYVFSRTAIFAVIPILIFTHLKPVPIYYVFIVTTFFFIMGSARFIPTMSALTNLAEPRFRGGYMSLNSALQQMGSGLAAQLAGALITTQNDRSLLGYNRVGYVAFLFTFVALFVFSQINKSK